jgi:hypothetical protein
LISTRAVRHWRSPLLQAMTFIGIAACLVIAPVLWFGNVWGYDFDFHIPMWLTAAQQFHEGVLYPRWNPGADAGFGQPSLIFYPPLSWFLGGGLGLILPWRYVPAAYVFLVLLLGGFAMWKCASAWLAPTDAIAASVLYLMNPYMMAMVFKRCSYGELLASALFPLLLWLAIRMRLEPRRTALALGATFAVIWLADLPAGVIATYSLTLLLLAASWIRRSPRPALFGAAAMATAFASLAFFLFPALWERSWAEVSLALQPEWLAENNFLFARSVNPTMLLYARSMSILGLLLVIVAAAAAATSFRLRRSHRYVWLALVILAAASAFLLFRPSLFLWQLLPELRYVEFPTRWLTPLCAASAILVASSLAQFRRTWMAWSVWALALGVLIAGMVYTVRWDTRNKNLDELIAETRSGTGYKFTENADWMRPRGSHPSRLPLAAPLIAPTDSGDTDKSRPVRIQVDQWSAERKIFSVDSPRPLRLAIKLLAYPAWQALVNGRATPVEQNPDSGQMLLSVPPGLTRTELTFTRTWDRTLGDSISLATVLLVVALVLAGRWRRRAKPVEAFTTPSAR